MPLKPHCHPPREPPLVTWHCGWSLHSRLLPSCSRAPRGPGSGNVADRIGQSLSKQQAVIPHEPQPSPDGASWLPGRLLAQPAQRAISSRRRNAFLCLLQQGRFCSAVIVRFSKACSPFHMMFCGPCRPFGVRSSRPISIGCRRCEGRCGCVPVCSCAPVPDTPCLPLSMWLSTSVGAGRGEAQREDEPLQGWGDWAEGREVSRLFHPLPQSTKAHFTGAFPDQRGKLGHGGMQGLSQAYMASLGWGTYAGLRTPSSCSSEGLTLCSSWEPASQAAAVRAPLGAGSPTRRLWGGKHLMCLGTRCATPATGLSSAQ